MNNWGLIFFSFFEAHFKFDLNSSLKVHHEETKLICVVLIQKKMMSNLAPGVGVGVGLGVGGYGKLCPLIYYFVLAKWYPFHLPIEQKIMPLSYKFFFHSSLKFLSTKISYLLQQAFLSNKISYLLQQALINPLKPFFILQYFTDLLKN